MIGRDLVCSTHILYMKERIIRWWWGQFCQHHR